MRNVNSIFSPRLRRILALAATAAITACASGPKTALHAPAEAYQFLAEAAPAREACPSFLPAGAQCWRGKDSAGAPYFMVMPAKWSGNLFVHSHGGPFLGAPTDARANEDIQRWSIIVREGHAYAASVFRQGGFAVTTAAQDTERVRQIFSTHIAAPKRTLLHGQSWGAMVATRAAELYPKSWDGILLTSGVVAGATTYDFRVDLRALYQSLCNNHPRPNEPQYALNLGLPAGATMTTADLTARVNACLALDKPAAQRTAEQQGKVKQITEQIRIPENSIQSHLNWGTSTLADVTRRHGGAVIANAADNAVRTGIVLKADTAARQRFINDVEHGGNFAVPVIAAHGIDDSTVFVEGMDTLKTRMQQAGKADNLVQNYVNSNQHSYWGDALYPPLFNALLAWVNEGKKPTAQGIANACQSLQAAQQPAKNDCTFLPDYVVKPLSSRIPPR